MSHYPLHQPIRSSEEATRALSTIAQGHIACATDTQLCDRLIEVVMFTAAQSWQELEGIKHCPSKFEPTLIVNFSDPFLVSPGYRVCNGPPGYIKRKRPSGPGARFFEQASCINLLGSMETALLFRSMTIQRMPQPWPPLRLWEGPEAVLDPWLTARHRLQRETSPAESATQSRRL